MTMTNGFTFLIPDDQDSKIVVTSYKKGSEIFTKAIFCFNDSCCESEKNIENNSD